jgi:hypothetical protein
VHDVGAPTIARHRQVDPERGQRRVAGLELVALDIRCHVGLVAIGPEAAHLHLDVAT